MDRFESGVTLDEPGRLVVSLSGELDLAAADALWNDLEPLFTGERTLVLDGTGLEFLDSGGLRVLARAAKLAAQTGVALRLVAPNPVVQRTLTLAGAEKLIELRDSVAEALA